MAGEKYLERKTREAFEKRGGECIKFLPSKKGLPDRIGLLNGRVWFIELKTTGKTLSPLQEWWRRRLTALGFEWRLIDTIESLNQLIEEL